MRLGRVLLCGAFALSYVVGASAATSFAEPGPSGCAAVANPGDNSGSRDVQLMTVDAAVARSMRQITSAFYDLIGVSEAELRAMRTDAFAAEDKNADGLVCVTLLWGDKLNPNAHWALIYADYLSGPTATEAFRISDNRTGR
jgi:hypothetical protein